MWSEVPGWPGVSVSRAGLLRGPSGKVLKPYVGREGHLHVLIGGRKLRVHHAVLLTFVGPRPEGLIGRHLNDDPDDNRVENLAWGTRKDNADDRRRNRGYLTREASPQAKLTERQAEAIRTDRRSSRVVAGEYGVSHTTVLEIRRGNRWAA